MIAARTEADLDRTGEHIKKISPKTQVVKVVTDVSDKSSVENLFKEAFKRFPEVDVSDVMVRLMVDTCEQCWDAGSWSSCGRIRY